MPVALIVPEALREEPTGCARLLREAGFEVSYPTDASLARGGLDAEATIRELQRVSAVVASGESYSDAILAALPELRVIARCGVGYDCVDVEAATDRRIAVTITPNSNREAVAELALALIFGVSKTLVVNDRAVRAGRWPRKPLRPLRGQTLGVFGLGRIGATLAARGTSLGMRVIASEKYPNPELLQGLDVELVDFDRLLAESDYLSIHCPLNDETRQLFAAPVFAKMKRGSVLVNTSRGGVVCERDLLDALDSGHLGGAGLDVFEQEPPAADNPLFQRDDVVVSPHMGGVDELSIEAMGMEAADCIARLSRNEWPAGAVVNGSLQGRWDWAG